MILKWSNHPPTVERKIQRENIYLEIKRGSLAYNFIFSFFFQGRERSFAAFNWPASRAANFNGLRPDVCSFSSPPACIYFLYINLNSYKSGDWLSISLITDKIVVVVVVVGNAVLKMLEQLGISSVKKKINK